MIWPMKLSQNVFLYWGIRLMAYIFNIFVFACEYFSCNEICQWMCYHRVDVQCTVEYLSCVKRFVYKYFCKLTILIISDINPIYAWQIKVVYAHCSSIIFNIFVFKMCIFILASVVRVGFVCAARLRRLA